MPYRRLPNTDKARLRAFTHSIRKFESEGITDLPYSEQTLQAIRTLFPKFKNALINLEAARKNQSEKNKDYLEIYKKARMYVSHYIQVMNFGIARGELKPTVRNYYGTDRFDNHIPQLQNEQDLIKWGQKIIEGDQQRIMKGGSPFYNPSIALVKINYEKFLDSYRFQQNLIATTERSANLVTELREEVDQLIVLLWNEIEASFEHLPDDQKREQSEAFGLVYVLRRKEKKRLQEQASKLEEEKDQDISKDNIDSSDPEPLEHEPSPTIQIVSTKEIQKEKERKTPTVFQSELNF